MATDDNKAVIRHWYAAINSGDVGVADEVYWSTDHAERLKEFVTMMRQAWPDWQVTIDTLVAEGDQVAVHWTSRGTHHGKFPTKTFGEIEPTGKAMTWRGAEFYRMAGGKIVESHGVYDAFGMLQQFGVVPVAP